MDVNSDTYYKYSRHWSDFSSYSDIPTIADNYWDMYDYSNIRVVSADYVKLQSISLTYDLEEKLPGTLGIPACSTHTLRLQPLHYMRFCTEGQTPTQGADFQPSS